MEATRNLREEHRLILQVLDSFETVLEEARTAGRVARAGWEPFVEFFQGFADRCHHCKEEGHLFPCLEQCGIPREGGPIGVMLYEHEQGRRLVRAIAERLDAADRGDGGAVQAVISNGQQFLDLLRNHISKEDQVLFNIADQVVQGPRLAGLTKEYRAAEADSAYCATVARCRDIAEKLCAGRDAGSDRR